MIAFSSSRDSHDGNHDIFIMMADGSRLRNLTKNPKSWDYLPAWSGDGRKFAFTSEREGNAEIYVIDADGAIQPISPDTRQKMKWLRGPRVNWWFHRRQAR